MNKGLLAVCVLLLCTGRASCQVVPGVLGPEKGGSSLSIEGLQERASKQAGRTKVSALPPATVEEQVDNLRARQAEFALLPDTAKTVILQKLSEEVDRNLDFRNALANANLRPSDLLNEDPDRIPVTLLPQTNTNVQQVVNPELKPIVLTPNVAKPTGSQIDPTLTQVIIRSLPNLSVQSRSVGRLLYTTTTSFNSKSPRWSFVATVFVSRKGIVATACHALDEMVTSSRGLDPEMKKNIQAGVEFGTGPEYGQVYPVTKLLGVGDKEGLDVAFLAIDGADDRLPMTMSSSKSPPLHIAVIGYPNLHDLDTQTCDKQGLDLTTAYYCAFHKAYPTNFKIAAPATTKSAAVRAVSALGFSYEAPTRFGQSGGPVLDLDTNQVVGIHYCCTGFAEQNPVLQCETTHSQGVSWNEAISALTLESNPHLSGFITADSTDVASALGTVRLPIPALSSGAQRAGRDPVKKAP